MTRTALLMSLLSLLVLGTACSHDSGSNGSWNSPVAPVTPVVQSSSSDLVGPEGGAVSVGGTVLTIPAGVLSESTEVTLQVVLLGSRSVLVVRPFGLALEQGGDLRFDQAPAGAADLSFHVSRLDPATGTWQDLGSASQLASSMGQLGVGERDPLDDSDKE